MVGHFLAADSSPMHVLRRIARSRPQAVLLCAVVLSLGLVGVAAGLIQRQAAGQTVPMSARVAAPNDVAGEVDDDLLVQRSIGQNAGEQDRPRTEDTSHFAGGHSGTEMRDDLARPVTPVPRPAATGPRVDR